VAFKLASLFVELTAKDASVKQELAGVRGELSRLDVAVAATVGNLASGLIQSAASAIYGFFQTGISGAVDLAETTSKVEAIFGDTAGVILDQADAMADRFGTVKQVYLDAASSFGASFKAAGVAAGEAAEIGNRLAKLGMDMASFGNASDAEVFTALNAALRGEFDPLERFNVMINAAAVEQEALRLGLINSSKELDEAAKKQATLSLIMAKTTDQQGDLERTADGSANSWRRFTGTLTNMAVEVGTTLEPALNALLNLGNELVGSLSGGWEALKGYFESFTAAIVAGVETIGVVWRNLADVWTIYSLTIQEAFQNYIYAPLSVAFPNLLTLAEWFGRNFVNLMRDAAVGAWTAFQNLGTNLGNLFAAVWEWIQNPAGGFQFEWTPILAGFEATTEQLPELLRGDLISLQDEIDAAGERMAAREADRAQRIFDARNQAAVEPGADLAGAAGAAGGGEFKHQILGAADFAAKLRGGIFGEQDTAKKQLAAQEKTAENTGEIADELKKPKLAVLG